MGFTILAGLRYFRSFSIFLSLLFGLLSLTGCFYGFTGASVQGSSDVSVVDGRVVQLAVSSSEIDLILTGDPAGEFALEAITTLPGDLRAEFYVDGIKEKTENLEPYSLFGDRNGELKTGSYGPSEHKIEVRFYDQKGSTILAESSIVINAVTEPSVELVLTGDPNSEFKLEAKTPVSGDLRAEFFVDGALEKVENEPPYSLFGDDGSNLYSGSLGAGEHTVTVHLYEQNGTTALAKDSMLIGSPDSSNEPFSITLEAESMQTKTTGGAADGGWNIWSNGEISDYVEFPYDSTFQFEITAKGTPANGVYPSMELRVDGQTVATANVTSDVYKVYAFPVEVIAGTRKVAIAFTNDLRTTSEDRNLYVDKITIHSGSGSDSGGGSDSDGSGSGLTPFDSLTPEREIWVSTSGSDASGTGSQSNPYGSIVHALNQATPGTAVMVKAGTYSSRWTWPAVDGEPNRPIWLISADGPGAAIIGQVSSNNFAIRGWGRENLVIDGFEILGGVFFASEGGSAGTYFDPEVDNICRNIVIRNSSLSKGGEDNIKGAQCVGYYVINNDLYSPVNESALDFVAVNDLHIIGNKVWDVAHTTFSIKGGSKDVIVRDNHIFNVSSFAINGGQSTDTPYMWEDAVYNKYEAKNVLIENNTIEGAPRAIQLMACDTCTVRGNTVVNFTSYGVNLEESKWTHPEGTGWLSRYVTIENNCFSDSDWLKNWAYDNSTPLIVEGNQVGSCSLP